MTLLVFLLGLGVGVVVALLGRQSEEGASTTWRRWRRDRSREAVVLAWEHLNAWTEQRALKWGRRAVWWDPHNPEAHAALASCLGANNRDESALAHHRRAERMSLSDPANFGWRLQNAVDAALACMELRRHVPDKVAQDLWDEAAGWARVAHEIDSQEAHDLLARYPWLAGMQPRQEWLRP